jgi:hypothetical protein
LCVKSIFSQLLTHYEIAGPPRLADEERVVRMEGLPTPALSSTSMRRRGRRLVSPHEPAVDGRKWVKSTFELWRITLKLSP